MSIDTHGLLCYAAGMIVRKFIFPLFLFAALVAAPVSAQDEFSEPTTEAEEAEAADEDDAETRKSKKKKNKKKGSKKAKGKKASRDNGEGADIEATEAEKEAGAQAAVPAALAKFKQIGTKPNLKAEYYIYLYSASWCRYCKECMPVAASSYRKMRNKKVELIVIGGDKTESEAKAYLKASKMKCPGIMFNELQATKFSGLPGCGMPGFPAISVVDKNGTIISNVVGAAQVKDVLKNWKKHTGTR